MEIREGTKEGHNIGDEKIKRGKEEKENAIKEKRRKKGNQ